VFTECGTSYQGLVRGRDADACVAIQTGECVLGVALESLKPTRVCVCVCMLFFAFELRNLVVSWQY